MEHPQGTNHKVEILFFNMPIRTILVLSWDIGITGVQNHGMDQ